MHSFYDCKVTDLLSLHGRLLSIQPDLFVVSHQFIAKRREHDEVVSILRQHGAKEEESSRAMLLRRAAVEKDTERLKSLMPPLEGVKVEMNDLAGRRFVFLYTEGAEERQNGVLLLSGNGTIGEHSHSNESTWKVDEEGRVLIRHKNNRISIIQNKISVQDGKYELRGPF